MVLRVVLAEFYRSNGDLGDRHCQAGVVCSPLALVSNCVLWTRDYVAELGRLFVEQSSCCVGTLEILEVEQVEGEYKWHSHKGFSFKHIFESMFRYFALNALYIIGTQ